LTVAAAGLFRPVDCGRLGGGVSRRSPTVSPAGEQSLLCAIYIGAWVMSRRTCRRDAQLALVWTASRHRATLAPALPPVSEIGLVEIADSAKGTRL
jgi:hypothetical protein